MGHQSLERRREPRSQLPLEALPRRFPAVTSSSAPPVHGGALVEIVIFRPNRNGAVFGYVLLRRVCELLQHELVEMKHLLHGGLRPRP